MATTQAERTEVILSMQPFVESKLKLLAPPEKLWQPSDAKGPWTPNPQSPNFADEINQLRQQSASLPDAVWVVLVGNTVTEENLPAYVSWINRLPGIQDNTGIDQHPWAKWLRGWGGEEHRHETILDRFLYLSGQVDMAAVERTVHHLARNGFHPGIDQHNQYQGMFYVRFQELATQLSHSNLGKACKQYGHEILFNICEKIAGDEGRHALFYGQSMEEIFNIDPDGAMIATNQMIKTGVTMPAALMSLDSEDVSGQKTTSLFDDYAIIAQALGIYTFKDYIDLMYKVTSTLKINQRRVTDPNAEIAQANILKTIERRSRALDRIMSARQNLTPVELRFAWIFDRAIPMKEVNNLINPPVMS